MDQNQTSAQFDETLRKHWSTIEPQIIQKYSGVEQADLQGCTDFSDLLERVSTKSGQSTDVVQNDLRQLVETASAGSPS